MDKAINVAVSSDKDNGNEFAGDVLNILPEMNGYSGMLPTGIAGKGREHGVVALGFLPQPDLRAYQLTGQQWLQTEKSCGIK